MPVHQKHLFVLTHVSIFCILSRTSCGGRSDPWLMENATVMAMIDVFGKISVKSTCRRRQHRSSHQVARENAHLSSFFKKIVLATHRSRFSATDRNQPRQRAGLGYVFARQSAVGCPLWAMGLTTRQARRHEILSNFGKMLLVFGCIGTDFYR